MVEKSKKEDIANVKKDEQLQIQISNINSKFKLLSSSKKESLMESFLSTFSSTLNLWTNKIKNETIFEELYILTASHIEFALREKDFNFIDQLSSGEKSNLLRFFYTTYERITTKKNCLTLKPTRIYTLHQSTISSIGVGSIHRAMFSMQK